jgi:hypothetical protein
MGRDRPSTIKVHHLAGCMDAGIGAAGRHGLNRTMGVEAPDRNLQRLLHAGQACLPLPTMKRLTVVLDAQGNPAKGRDRRL